MSRRGRDGAASTPQRIRQRERAADAVHMRAQGIGYRQIADQLGYPTANAACQSVMRALDQHEARQVEHLRNLEAQRLDLLWSRAWHAVADADPALLPQLITAAVRVSERRARMFGLDMQASEHPAHAGADVMELRQQFTAIIEARGTAT